MSSPQTENGHVRIANELYDAILKFPFTKRELFLVLAVIRKTYGFSKKSDDMTMTQLENDTCLTLQHIGVTINGLADKKVLIVKDGFYGKNIGINKHYREWVKVTKTVSKVTKTVSKKVTDSVSPEVTKTVSRGNQNGKLDLPKQEVELTKTVTTINNSNRQLQQTTPKGAGGSPSAPTAAAWESYALAYRNRYGVSPVRNATTNGQMMQFIGRVGREAAPGISEYYVQHNDSFYVRKMHTVGLMLADAEKLHTEWATKTQMTGTKARQTEQTQENISIADELKREIGNG